MSEKDYSKSDDFINDIVDAATRSMNFEQLSKDISDSIQTVFEEIGVNTNISDHIKKQGYGGQAKRSASQRTGTNAQSAPDMSSATSIRETKAGPIAVRNPKGTLSGIILTALGATFTSIFALSEFVVIVLSATIRPFTKAGIITSIVLLPFLIISIFVVVVGAKRNGRVKRFKKYLKEIGSRKYCPISELAAATGKSEKYTADDLQGMIDRNFFINAHIDEAKTTLMLDEETYQLYRKSAQEYHRQEEREAYNERIFSAEGTSGNDELAQALSEGKKYFDQIHEANEAIPDPVMSEKISRMEEVIKKIFEVIRRKPDQLHKLRRFMKYYMPITVKLLQAYRELCAQPADLENVQKSKKEIEDTLDTINYAYEKLLDSFFEDSSIDISSDISVLQSMFAQEGLSPDPFEKNRNENDTMHENSRETTASQKENTD